MEYNVTIGIPVYNIEKYVSNSILSALSQTLDNIEILVLDDCGTDSSMDIVRKIKSEHPRGKDIRIVQQPSNGGLGRARNRIIEEAKGKYLFHLDGDDAISPNAIQILYEHACSYQAEIVYGSFEIVEEQNGEVKKTPQPKPFKVFTKEDEWPSYVYSDYDILPSSTCNFLISVDIYRKYHLRHLPINFWEDHTFTMDLPTYITRAVLLPDITYYYYFRNGSLSNFQKRLHIDKKEIQTTINAMSWVKMNSDRICYKPYFSLRMKKVMMTCFYIVCSILRNEKIISPSFTNKELQDIMIYPISFVTVCCFRQWRLQHIALFLLGRIPSSLSVFLIKMVAKYKGFI